MVFWWVGGGVDGDEKCGFICSRYVYLNFCLVFFCVSLCTMFYMVAVLLSKVIKIQLARTRLPRRLRRVVVPCWPSFRAPRGAWAAFSCS